ncbi:MAG: C10 family peptidase [Bacteroidales bacterium]|nr:C10 family peptidase [Bacteroidales bacterium]
MMKTIFIQLTCLFLSLICFIPSEGQIVTKEEAAIIAQNWITIVIDSYGTWGGVDKATIMPVRSLEKDGRKLGYYCNVTPKGFILVSIRKELAPVKLYSEMDSYINDEVDCLPDLIYYIPARVINAIETKLAPIESVSSVELKEILEIDYSDAWDQVYNYIPGTYTNKNTGSSGKDGYQEGDSLLTSNWHQGVPYNGDCLLMDPPCNNSNGRALVGCIATAAAQIMNYWDWPPYGVAPYNDPYDWPNILDTVTNGSSQPEKDAVAELCAEVGEAIEMDYGCDVSTAYIYCPTEWFFCGENSDLESVLVDTFYFSSTLSVLMRNDYDSIDWFNKIKLQINASRPIAYQFRTGLFTRHDVVVDGWQVLGDLMQYHINFGWGNSWNKWFTLDAITDYIDDLMLVYIKPVNAVGSIILTGTHPKLSFPYRYFDMDAVGVDAVFSEGQYLQFFTGITVTGLGTSSQPIRFYGTNAENLRLFTRGDVSNGIRLRDGEIELTNLGSMKLY